MKHQNGLIVTLESIYLLSSVVKSDNNIVWAFTLDGLHTCVINL